MILQVHRLVQLAAINGRNDHHAEPSDISTISFLFHSRDSPKIQANQPLNRLRNIIAFRRSRSFLSFRHFLTSTIFFYFFYIRLIHSFPAIPIVHTFSLFILLIARPFLLTCENWRRGSPPPPFERQSRVKLLSQICFCSVERAAKIRGRKSGADPFPRNITEFSKGMTIHPLPRWGRTLSISFSPKFGAIFPKIPRKTLFSFLLSLSLSVSRRIRSLKGTSKLNGAFTLCRYSNAFESSSFFWYGARRERIREKAKN